MHELKLGLTGHIQLVDAVWVEGDGADGCGAEGGCFSLDLSLGTVVDDNVT